MTPDAREWLEADGLGGFAMGTADGIRTRRYHAMLVVATRAPDGRQVQVADLEIFVETSGGRFALSSHRYHDDVIHPDGITWIKTFAWKPWPRWEWTLPDGTRIVGELVVERGVARTNLRWTRVAGDGPARLTVRPLLACRDFHALHHENPAFRFDAEVSGEHVTWRPYPSVPAISASSNGRYTHAPDWYRKFSYVAERERGLDDEEDLATPGIFDFDLAVAPAAMTLAVDPAPGDARVFVDGRAPRDLANSESSCVRFLRLSFDRAADQYLVTRGSGRTVIAGYPWFCDWGRDTFISLRGLAGARRDVAREILLQWSRAVSDGMLPNRYTDEVPEYNSVDASLWFVVAADAYLAGATTGDDRRVLEAAIDEIVAGYVRGTRHRIGATPDGLLAAGEPGLQLTWMDAKVGDEVITPRIGKPVEIQALWLNALAIAGRRTPSYRELSDLGRATFAARFWDAERGHLYDVIDCDHVAGTVDSSCRPNQLFAIGGLPLQLVDGERARAVVDLAEHALWTPAGPRSLATHDPRYRGRYTGGPAERDRVYHEGAIWPWLAGAFVEAWVRVRGSTAEAKRDARGRFLAPLLARTELAGLGHLSEICEGDPPHRPVGCPFQAWSMAELLRLDRDVLR